VDLAGCGALLVNLSIPNLFGNHHGVDQAWVSFVATYTRVLLRERESTLSRNAQGLQDKLDDLYSYTVYLESPRPEEAARDARALAHGAKIRIIERESRLLSSTRETISSWTSGRNAWLR